eukprot:9329012-Karenia_brevis.AAC.1
MLRLFQSWLATAVFDAHVLDETDMRRAGLRSLNDLATPLLSWFLSLSRQGDVWELMLAHS